MKLGAPATNVTIEKELATRIEVAAKSLEQSNSPGTRNNAKSSLLSGSWRLIYSNGPEITSLASNLPLGFSLGPTYQPLDTTNGFFENRGCIEHPWHIARLQTNVIGDVRVADFGTQNAIGILNDKGNRVEVDFRVITFELTELFGQPLHFQKKLFPSLDADAVAPPANDVTYLDQNTRIVRGGDGALFIFIRDDTTIDGGGRMMRAAERDILFGGRTTKSGVSVGIGAVEQSPSPELQFLFQQRQ